MTSEKKKELEVLLRLGKVNCKSIVHSDWCKQPFPSSDCSGDKSYFFGSASEEEVMVVEVCEKHVKVLKYSEWWTQL